MPAAIAITYPRSNDVVHGGSTGSFYVYGDVTTNDDATVLAMRAWIEASGVIVAHGVTHFPPTDDSDWTFDFKGVPEDANKVLTLCVQRINPNGTPTAQSSRAFYCVA